MKVTKEEYDLMEAVFNAAVSSHIKTEQRESQLNTLLGSNQEGVASIEIFTDGDLNLGVKQININREDKE